MKRHTFEVAGLTVTNRSTEDDKQITLAGSHAEIHLTDDEAHALAAALVNSTEGA